MLSPPLDAARLLNNNMEQISFEQLLGTIQPQLLDQKITNNMHLEEIAQLLGNWKAAIVYLGLSEADEEEIKEENSRVDARRLVLYATTCYSPYRHIIR